MFNDEKMGVLPYSYNLNLSLTNPQMENVTEWQHPFVDVFKKYGTFDAPKSFKGSVTIIHVPLLSIRTPLSQGSHSKLQGPSCPITQSPSLIPLARSRPATSSVDTYLSLYSALR